MQSAVAYVPRGIKLAPVMSQHRAGRAEVRPQSGKSRLVEAEAFAPQCSAEMTVACRIAWLDAFLPAKSAASANGCTSLLADLVLTAIARYSRRCFPVLL
jgi:hypothetical protein